MGTVTGSLKFSARDECHLPHPSPGQGLNPLITLFLLGGVSKRTEQGRNVTLTELPPHVDLEATFSMTVKLPDFLWVGIFTLREERTKPTSGSGVRNVYPQLG